MQVQCGGEQGQILNRMEGTVTRAGTSTMSSTVIKTVDSVRTCVAGTTLQFVGQADPSKNVTKPCGID